MKKELYDIIEYCKSIKADDRAKRVGCEMWKKTVDRYMRSTMVTLEQCHLRWLKAAITQYEVTTLSREVFFIYMQGVIEEYVK